MGDAPSCSCGWPKPTIDLVISPVEQTTSVRIVVICPRCQKRHSSRDVEVLRGRLMVDN
jgi:hypothetical protein